MKDGYEGGEVSFEDVGWVDCTCGGSDVIEGRGEGLVVSDGVESGFVGIMSG